MSKDIKFKSVIEDGHIFFIFVAVETQTKILIAYAWSNNFKNPTHEQVFQTAIQLGLYSGNTEPYGGGTINTNTCEYTSSIQYGPVEDYVEHAARLKSGTECE